MKVALVGNPNCGKTTLFNRLTHGNQKIGNWPGVTIERKSGIIENTAIECVDLPGIYSLNSYTLEEQITQNYLFEEKPDLIINVIDVTLLERSLYLTSQLFDLNCPLLLVFNMMDCLSKKGIQIDFEYLKKQLRVPIVFLSAISNQGIHTLIQQLKNGNWKKEKMSIFSFDVEKQIALLEKKDQLDSAHPRLMAIQQLEEKKVSLQTSNLIVTLETKYHLDIEQLLITQRYQWVDKLVKPAIQPIKNHYNWTDRLDTIFLHRWGGLLLFVCIMAFIYFLSIGFVGSLLTGYVNQFFDWIQIQLQRMMIANQTPLWVKDLICNGIFVGVSTILSFIPQLFLLFLCLSFLEASGYMSRIAFLLDKLFVRFGLSGKSLIPFIIGTGCSVPGIMSCRIIKEDSERKMTVMLTPFIPCSAKLPIISLFCQFFFKKSAWLVSFSFYLLAILIILVSAYCIKKIFYSKTSTTPFIQELPDYQWPRFSFLLKDINERILHFVKKTGSLILACSILLWFFLSFTWEMHYIDKIHYTIEDSILASIGKMFSWFFYPIIGELNWAATVSSFQGLIAKEQVVSSMAIIQGISQSASAEAIFSNQGMFQNFTPISAYAFVTFNLFSVPCLGSVSAMKQELGSKKRLILAIIFQIMIAWILSSFIFCLGSILKMIFY